MVNLFVEALPAVYLCCDALIVAEDVASAMRFQNEKRRREHLAWRRIVRRELGAKVHIDYNDVGAPVVDVDHRWISVAHGGESVAVAIADEPVGVDIECLDRDFDRVAPRYMTSEELLISQDDKWSCYVWCAKEAMYKLYGRRGVELRGELRVESFDSESMTIYGSMEDMSPAIVKISLYDDDIVVAVATFR
ncbi:MAG: 4'-phosphopantetheinyl transferase superfamily protein [Alistipes sp.]|nr:4'-phosphopantetheinyl transferase superfamily protein [Alistipes sp.]